MSKSRSGSTSEPGVGDSPGSGVHISPLGPSKSVSDTRTDGRTGGVKKTCDECGGSSPVACRICTVCGADFFSNAGDKGGESPDESESDFSMTSGERRRSERVKRDKPDYYDALDFEHSKRGSGKRGKRGSGILGRPRKESSSMSSILSQSNTTTHSRGRGRGGTASTSHSMASSSSGRATLTWKKGHDDYEDERDRRRKKRPRHNRDNDPDEDYLDDLSSEKNLQCRVGLAEINRKLGVVMMQPG